MTANRPSPHEPRPSLSRTARLYIAAVTLAGIGVTVQSALSLAARPVPNEWLVLAALTLLTGSFTIKIPSLAARISISDAFVFSTVLLFGPAPATIIVALDSFFISLWMRSDGRVTQRSLFNLAAVAIAIWTASHTFFLLTGTAAGDVAALLPLERHLWPLFSLAALYFLINSWLVAGALAFEKSLPITKMWWNNFTWLSLNYFAGVSAAALLVSYSPTVDIRTIAIIIPLLLVSYLTYRTSIARVEDATHHVNQLHSLYIATIEALALAVDAKDQITHGHIRRVQTHAVQLARLLGVADESHIQAVEAAALLHDMGKLAIPEHILNKPGKLTSAEFEIMKTHASVGADLLSSVRFPYPVVPIVRHHHENWNGTGYPAGLSGADIPIGARILAVVDCFDALTSDRPYRPALSVTEAFEILKERRGSMYDPWVIDTFISAISHGTLAVSDHSSERLDEDTIPAQMMHDSHLSTEHSEAAASGIEPDGLIVLLAEDAMVATGASVVAVFRYCEESDAIRCTYAAGQDAASIAGLQILRGERVSGWVAANARPMTNAYASLDLGQLVEQFRPPLRSALAVPLVEPNRGVGTITCYSPTVNAFEDAHREAVEELCSQFESCQREASHALSTRSGECVPVSARP